ncbi:recombination mediator RecR [Planctopirus hydrillae]|uniref:Recombination protein RecR n=1 Tax=Planctopirus hydrillae TaxID=1841610 RepID=A0A1C3E8D0_9PLAN|nr:recombination mediator RecR [Planctopirus hydrillae]ODA29505.1 recombination protein RecR [Planctopirus hydrillae]
MPRAIEPNHHAYGRHVGLLVQQLAALPGIGQKSAERLAQHLLDCSEEEAAALAHAILDVRRTIRRCSVCHNLTEQETCDICLDSRRDQGLVCIVEQPRDLLALEATGTFGGVYHVLGGRIAPLSGVGPDDLNLATLIRRVKSGKIRELVMATNPTLEGDGTALYIVNLLADEPVKITRLARGIATGSVLEFANREMLSDALKGRQSF